MRKLLVILFFAVFVITVAAQELIATRLVVSWNTRGEVSGTGWQLAGEIVLFKEGEGEIDRRPIQSDCQPHPTDESEGICGAALTTDWGELVPGRYRVCARLCWTNGVSEICLEGLPPATENRDDFYCLPLSVDGGEEQTFYVPMTFSLEN